MSTVKGSGLKMQTKDKLLGFIFISPWVVGFLLFTLYPVIFSLLLSVNQYELLPDGAKMDWRGLEYFNHVFNVDTKFKIRLGDTMLFIGCATPVVIVFALIISILLNGKYPARTFFRVIFFMPVVIMSGPVISNLLSSYTTDFSGNAPQIFQFVNNLPGFLSKPVLLILDNLVLMLWFSGVQILLFLVGLQKISPDLYEAADIDGAGSWEKFWKITLPFMKPLLLLAAVYTVMTLSNYPNNSVNVQIQNSMQDTESLYSRSAAMSWIYFISIALVLLVIYIVFTLFGRKEKYERSKD